jgi:hypothetical protein
MKVILSRKGFDSSNGGIPSPIMEDGQLIPFPIPSCDLDRYDDLYYKDDSYQKLVSDLKYKGGATCHVDPDLTLNNRKKEIKGWCPVFGQINSSSMYLQSSVGVAEGDLFLFFGNYHFVEKSGEKYRFVKKTDDFYKDRDIQLIWGYLQVGKIITKKEDFLKYSWHPHANEERICNPSNVMFVAREKLSFNENMSGAGVFKYDEKRVLTAKGCNKATWIKNIVYDVNSVVGNRKNSCATDSGIYYAGIWQELGLKETKECEDWAKSLF